MGSGCRSRSQTKSSYIVSCSHNIRLDKLEKMVEGVGLRPADIVPYYALLLAIPTGDRDS